MLVLSFHPLHTFENFIDVLSVVVDAVLIIQCVAGIRSTVLCDVDGRVAIPVLDPVDQPPQAPWYHIKPT